MNLIGALNTEFIKRRRAELGLSTRALASATGTTASGLRALERDVNQGGVTLGFLARLARALSCELADLFARTGTEPASDEAPTDPRGDGARLGTVLHTTGVLTPIAALVEITGWPLERVTAALEHLEGDLGRVGLVLHRLGNRVTIRARADVDGELVAAAVRSHLNRDGLDLGEARLLRRILNGDLPRQPTNGEQVALGVLVNARLVTADGQGGWKAHPDVVFSLSSQ